MVDVPNGKVVAPYIGTVEKTDSVPSFAGYFLRDLHQQGRLNQEVVRQVIEDKSLASSFSEVMAAISDARGASISEALARDLEMIAAIGSKMN